MSTPELPFSERGLIILDSAKKLKTLEKLGYIISPINPLIEMFLSFSQSPSLEIGFFGLASLFGPVDFKDFLNELKTYATKEILKKIELHPLLFTTDELQTKYESILICNLFEYHTIETIKIIAHELFQLLLTKGKLFIFVELNLNSTLKNPHLLEKILKEAGFLIETFTFSEQCNLQTKQITLVVFKN